MDISKLSVKELQNLLEIIPAEIKAREAEERKNALKEVTELAAKRGFKLEELIGQSETKAAVKTGTRRPAKIKYRSPDDHQLKWTGRGKKPTWVAAWLAKGKTLDELKV